MKKWLLLSIVACYGPMALADKVIFAGSEDLREFDKLLEKNQVRPGSAPLPVNRGPGQKPPATDVAADPNESKGADTPPPKNAFGLGKGPRGDRRGPPPRMGPEDEERRKARRERGGPRRGHPGPDHRRPDGPRPEGPRPH